MSDESPEKPKRKPGVFREVKREPDPRIVAELTEMLQEAQAGKLKTLAAFYDLEGEDLAISQFIEVGENSRTKLQFIGQFFLGSFTLALQLMSGGENQ